MGMYADLDLQRQDNISEREAEVKTAVYDFLNVVAPGETLSDDDYELFIGKVFQMMNNELDISVYYPMYIEGSYVEFPFETAETEYFSD